MSEVIKGFEINGYLHSITCARQYLELARLDAGKNAKHLFNCHINKLTFLYNDIYFNLDEEAKETIKRDTEDSLVLDSIRDMLITMEPDQRALVEEFTKGVKKGDVMSFDSPNNY